MTDDWSELKTAWTAPAPEPPLDSGLIRSVRRRAWLGRLNFYAEVAACLFAAAAGGWIARQYGEWTVGVAALLFATFSLALSVWARTGAETVAAETPRQALEAALAQARSGLRWARAGYWVGAAAIVFVGVVGLEQRPPPGLLLLMAVFLGACFILYARHARSARRRMEAHQAALDALDQS